MTNKLIPTIKKQFSRTQKNGIMNYILYTSIYIKLEHTTGFYMIWKFYIQLLISKWHLIILFFVCNNLFMPRCRGFEPRTQVSV